MPDGRLLHSVTGARGVRLWPSVGPVATGDRLPGRRGTTALRTDRRGHRPPEIKPSSAILVCDRDALFREALRNFLLAAGHTEVEIAATAREALASLRRGNFRYVLISLFKPFSRGRRLAMIARRRQHDARIVLLVSAQDQPLITDPSCDCVIKEYVFSNLLELM